MQGRSFVFRAQPNLLAVRFGKLDIYTVGLAQLVEHRIVVPGVVGSSPISHPTVKQEAGCAGLFQ